MQSTTSSASADQYARTVVFNMPNATDVTFASGMFGIFLAPKATVHGLGGTSSGWLVVDTLDKNGSEWHCVWSDMPDSSHIPVPAQLTAIKTVNGDRPGDDELRNILPAVVMLQLAHTREITEMPTMVVCM